MRTSDLPPLSEEDQAALRDSARDLSDIPSDTLARINAGFVHAYRVAEQLRAGQRNPLR